MEKHWSTIRDSFFIYLKYREGLPLVLKDLSFAIEAGQRVGIVGRTGAGKSSVTLTLFRIIELDQGKYFFEIFSCLPNIWPDCVHLSILVYLFTLISNHTYMDLNFFSYILPKYIFFLSKIAKYWFSKSLLKYLKINRIFKQNFFFFFLIAMF